MVVLEDDVAVPKDFLQRVTNIAKHKFGATANTSSDADSTRKYRRNMWPMMPGQVPAKYVAHDARPVVGL